MAQQNYEWEPNYDDLFQPEEPPPPAYEPTPPVTLPPHERYPEPTPFPTETGPGWGQPGDPADRYRFPENYLPPPPPSLERRDRGYIGGQETVAPGVSTTPSQADKYIQDARAAGISESFINQFLSGNPHDYSRIQSAYRSGGPGRTGGPGAPPPLGGGDSRPTGPPPKEQWEPIDWGKFFGPTGGPGVFSGATQQVGQDPLSQIITGALGDLIQRGGISPMGADIQETLRGIIGRGGTTGLEGGTEPLPAEGIAPTGRSRVSLRKESAREDLESARRTQTEQMRSRLASRGLAATPGAPSGAELGATGRMEERLQAPYAGALRDILAQEATFEEGRAEMVAQRQHQGLQNALQLATGIDQGQARFLLDSINAAGNRQEMLSNIALQTLDRNIAWNSFIAQLGLNRGQVLNELQAGRVESLLPLIQMFMQTGQTVAGGYV